MDLKGLSEYIKKYSPAVAASISETNPIAGIVVTLVASLFNANVKDYNDIIAKINEDPNAAIKLKQLELDNQVAILNAQVSDRENAREREETIVKLTGKRDRLLDWISVIVIAGYFLMCTFLIFNKIDNENNQVVYMMFGQLTGGFIMVLSYYFGSSNKST